MDTTDLERTRGKRHPDGAESEGLGAAAKKKKKTAGRKTAASKKKGGKKRLRVETVSEEPSAEATAGPAPEPTRAVKKEEEEPQELEEPRTPRAEEDGAAEGQEEEPQQPDSGRIKTRARARSRHLEINMAKAIETLTTARKRRRRRVVEPDAAADVVGPTEKLLTRLAQAEEDAPETQSPKAAEAAVEAAAAPEHPATQETAAAESAPSTLAVESSSQEEKVEIPAPSSAPEMAVEVVAEVTEMPVELPAPLLEPEMLVEVVATAEATETSEEEKPVEQGPTDAQLIASANAQEPESAEATTTDAATTATETATEMEAESEPMAEDAPKEEEKKEEMTAAAEPTTEQKEEGEEKKEEPVEVQKEEEAATVDAAAAPVAETETGGVKRARDEDAAAAPAAEEPAAAPAVTMRAPVKRRRELTPEERALQDPWHPRPGEVVQPGTYAYELYPENPIRSIWHLIAPDSDPRLQPHPEGVPVAPWRTVPPRAPFAQQPRPRRQLTAQEREWDRVAHRVPLSKNPYLLAYLEQQHPVRMRDPTQPLRWLTYIFLSGMFLLFVWMFCANIFLADNQD